MKILVTISASYGAGGSVVGPAVADRLDVEFLDRPLTAAETQQVGDAAGEGATEDERTEGILERLLSGFAQLSEVFNPDLVVTRDQRVRQRAEERLHAFEAESGGVVLGWGSALILPNAFHVRLDGPIEARLRQAMKIERLLDKETARRRQYETDRIRTNYMRRLYGVDVRDPCLYHLVIDSTAIPLAAAVDLIANATKAFFVK
jgi:cytidylate kinase